MNKTFTWTKNTDDDLVSEDGYVRVYKRDEIWILEDSLEGNTVEYPSKKQCLDEAGNRMMITLLGDFNELLRVMNKNNDLKFIHQII